MPTGFSEKVSHGARRPRPRVALVTAMLAIGWFTGWGAAPIFGQGAAPTGKEAPRSGQLIYAAACAPCHGIQGNGRGPGVDGFTQPATDFRVGAYKFRSTAFKALPSDADLERSIREGMPGTEMVPFGAILSKSEREAVADYLKTFSAKFAENGAKPQPVKLQAERPFPPSAETIAVGKEVYKDNDCADCHGDRGEGGSGEEDEQGRKVKMNSFPQGVFKSGRGDADLYRSIVTGMNGTTMEAYGGKIADQDVWKMVDYIRSLAKKPGFFATLFSDEPSGMEYPNH